MLTQVGDLLAPALEAGYANLVEAFTELSQWISENENDLRAWATVFGEVVNTAFTYIRGFIDAVLLPFKTLFNALQGIGAFLGVVDARCRGGVQTHRGRLQGRSAERSRLWKGCGGYK